MNEIEGLTPLKRNEEENNPAFTYSETSKRLARMKAQLNALTQTLENADELDRLVRAGISALLDLQRDLIIQLENKVEAIEETGLKAERKVVCPGA